jgi:hypothetical protein
MKRHPFDPFSFFFGVAFAVLGLGFLTGRVSLVDAGLSTLWPIPAVGLGLLFLILAVRREGVGSADGEPRKDADDEPAPANDER